jgi:hypothetical protein
MFRIIMAVEKITEDEAAASINEEQVYDVFG